MENQKSRELPEELKWIENLSNVLDNSFKVPFLGMRFGIDPLIGLVPGIGEIVSFGISALLVLAMVRHGASGMLALRMIGNVLYDTVLGAIPVAGDIFDFFKKANRRNVQLMKEYYEEGKHQGSGWGVLVLISLLFMGIGILLMYGVWSLLSALISLLG
jgi:hypothetical protein